MPSCIGFGPVSLLPKLECKPISPAYCNDKMNNIK